MQEFIYKAKDSEGKTIEAEIKAANVGDATKILVEKNLFPISIEPRKVNPFSELGEYVEKFRKVTSKDRVIFTRQLATLVKAGLPLAQALRLLRDQVENPKLSDIVREISISVEGGNTLSESMAVYPDVFDTIYINLVETGEVSGQLDEVLLRLANQEEKTHEINSKIRSAFTYPIVIMVVVVAVAALMITVVLPQVGNMYIELNQPLPLLTKALLGLSDFIKKFWYLIILLLIAVGYGVRMYIKAPSGKSKFDRLKMQVPIFKVLIKKLYMARFTRTLSTLISSGVSMLQALSIVSRSMNNIHLEKAIKKVASKVKSGAPLSKPISEDALFLPLVSQMISVGEQTGTIGDSLNKVADYYEDEVDQTVETISSLIEPATMVVLGLVVAFLIGAVLLPIYGLVTNIG